MVLRYRFEHLGELSDIEDTISKHMDAVDLTPDGHPKKPARLNSPGICFKVQFERLGDLSDLQDAISKHKDAVDLTPYGHPDKPTWLNNLGNAFKFCFKHLGELGDLEDAISMLRDAANSLSLSRLLRKLLGLKGGTCYSPKPTYLHTEPTESLIE